MWRLTAQSWGQQVMAAVTGKREDKPGWVSVMVITHRVSLHTDKQGWLEKIPDSHSSRPFYQIIFEASFDTVKEGHLMWGTAEKRAQDVPDIWRYQRALV